MTLADITCDSDGKLDRFVSAREGVDFDPILPLHELQPGEKYYLAMFLTGASFIVLHSMLVSVGIRHFQSGQYPIGLLGSCCLHAASVVTHMNSYHASSLYPC